jgi:hypothetical protein
MRDGWAARSIRRGPVERSVITGTERPVVTEVLSFDDLPAGSSASRRVVVRWSDGTEGEALRWYSDEVLFSEGDLLGKTQQQIRSLHFPRDRDSLQS